MKSRAAEWHGRCNALCISRAGSKGRGAGRQGIAAIAIIGGACEEEIGCRFAGNTVGRSDGQDCFGGDRAPSEPQRRTACGHKRLSPCSSGADAQLGAGRYHDVGAVVRPESGCGANDCWAWLSPPDREY